MLSTSNVFLPWEGAFVAKKYGLRTKKWKYSRDETQKYKLKNQKVKIPKKRDQIIKNVTFEEPNKIYVRIED